MLFPAMSFVAGLTVLLLLYFGGQQLITGKLSPGDFVTLLSYLGMLLWPAMGAGWVTNIIQRGAASMKRINAVLEEIPDISDSPEAEREISPGNLEFRSLHFSYPGGTEVLRDISFIAGQGSSTGILGRTGCGKSTLVKLIGRLIDPPAGTVFIGGKDIRDYRRDTLRSALGIVPQDVFLFSESIRNNIIFARPEASEKEIMDAAQAAGLTADLPFFPRGLDTMVGEKGVTLSGGQKQRIAIARALITDPEILILDDALSAVDAETEERILKHLFRIRRGRTTLLISHRVSALSRCDSCIVIEEGRITASGTHSELSAAEGFYREVAGMQSLKLFREDSA
jgi:ATP-binding cassette subfamily B protein